MSTEGEPIRGPRSGDGSPAHPVVGGVYWIENFAFDVIGKKDRRPYVVLGPLVGTGEFHVWPRTRQRDRPGTDHDPNPTIGLHDPGRFCPRDVTRLAEEKFRDPKLARYAGLLEPDFFRRLLERWQ